MASLRNRSAGSFGGRNPPGGPRDGGYRGNLLRENPWLQLQGRRCVLLNVPLGDPAGVNSLSDKIVGVARVSDERVETFVRAYVPAHIKNLP